MQKEISFKQFQDFLVTGDRKFLNQLIEFCTRISIAYISIRLKNFCYSERYDLAFSSITSLFLPDKSYKYGIITSYMDWKKEISNDIEFNFFLNRIVWKRSEQTLKQHYGYFDPIFEKIYNNINQTIQNSEFTKTSFLGRSIILGIGIDRVKGSIISDDEIEYLPDYLFFGKQKKLLFELFEYLEVYTDHIPAIPMVPFIKKLKMIHIKSWPKVNNDETYHFDFHDILEKALTRNKKHVREKYLEKGKISHNDFVKICNIFIDISNDILNGGIKQSLSVYFADQFQEIDSTEFYAKYHGIVNYSFRIFKSDIEFMIRDYH